MIRLRGDYHTHTIYSHGKGSVEDNIKAAIDQNLETIAITDHGPGHMFYGVRARNLKKQKEEILKLRDKFPQINILFGIEANFVDFQGNLDLDYKLIDEFDFLIAGFHNGIVPRDLKSLYYFYGARQINPFSQKSRDKLKDLATRAMIKASYKYDLKFISHPGAKFSINPQMLAEEINPNTMLEINNKHLKLSLEDLLQIDNPGIKFILNSDAHRPQDVGNVARALELVHKSKLSLDRFYNLDSR